MHIELNNALGGVYARLVDITDKHLSPPHGGGALQAGERRETGPSAPFNDCGGVDSDTHGIIRPTPSGAATTNLDGEVSPCASLKRGGVGSAAKSHPAVLRVARPDEGSRCNSGLQSPFITDARIALAVLLAVPVGFMVGAGLCVVFM